MARYLERMENHRDTGWRHEALHLIYRPASLGRQRRYRVRVPLLHRIHLIPGRVMDAACTRYEASHPHFAPEPTELPVVIPQPALDPELDALRQRAHP